MARPMQRRAPMGETAWETGRLKFLLGRYADEPPEVRRRARLVAAFSLHGFIGGLSLAASHGLWFGIPAPHLIAPLAAGLLCLLAAPALLATGRRRMAAHVITFCWMVACGWGAYLRGGLGSPPVMTQVAIPFIALTLLDRRAAFGWGVAVVAEMSL